LTPYGQSDIYLYKLIKGGNFKKEHNKSVVLQYFKEVLDDKKFDLMDELFTTDVIMHRPEGDLSNLSQIKVGFKTALSKSKMETTIHDIIATGDRLVVRLSHEQVFAEGERMRSRIGILDVGGKTITWNAIAIFRFREGKIAEEWVQLDDLGKLMQVGTLSLSSR
jgi:predicted SnoaL-like aldol condensation-catalyzing enzyme